jgi:Ca2+-binding RTX toxin-like protein
VVGSVSGTDPDAGNTLTYSLIDSADGRFALKAGKIVVADRLGLDYEQASSHTITVRATDQGGKFVDKQLSITLGNVTGETVYGDARDNTISAGAGADRLYGGLGSDRMSAGDGNDVYYVDFGSDTITETNANRATGGYDSVMSSTSYGLGANIESLFLGGTGAINGWGNELGNAIAGNGAANLIDGRLGNDYLTGGGGQDEQGLHHRL